MEARNKQRIERIENLIDLNTKELILLFRIINAGRIVNVPKFGEIRESVLLAAILHGIRKGEVEFEWFRGKQRETSLSAEIIYTNNGPKVQIVIDKRILMRMSDDVEAIGGTLPPNGETENIFGKLRKVNQKKRWRIHGWDETLRILSLAYALYRHV